jgi:uncharacterized protein YggU (UPF0235/DUF167 family)
MGYYEEKPGGKLVLRPQIKVALLSVCFFIVALVFYLVGHGIATNKVKNLRLQAESDQKIIGVLKSEKTALEIQLVQVAAENKTNKATIKSLIDLQKIKGKSISVPQGSVIKIESQEKQN